MYFLINLVILLTASKIFYPNYKIFIVLIFTFIPATQFGVGSDYYSYLNILENIYDINQYYDRNELISYFIFKIINEYNFNSKILFLFFGFFTSLFITISLNYLSKSGLNFSILIFLFICSTSFIHNQLNFIRLYLAVSIFFLSILLKFNNKNARAFLLFILSTQIHFSIFYFFPFYLFKNKIYFKNLKNILLNTIIQIILIIIIYFIMEHNFVRFIPDMILDKFTYTNYFTKNTDLNLIYIIYKLAFLPLFFLFIYEYQFNIKRYIPPNLQYGISLWSISYLLPLIGSFNEFGQRIGAFTNLYSIFPLYFLLKYCDLKIKFFTFSYILIIYLIKILLLEKNEYNFTTNLFYEF